MKDYAIEENIIEDIQKAIIDAGGRLFKNSEIRMMTINELLAISSHNDIEIIVKYKKL